MRKRNTVLITGGAASSSTYGDHPDLPKVEDKIGNPLNPYAVTKVVNELYASVFAKTYGFKTIGLRYFNIFGKRQDPNGVYAAAIPLFINQLIKKESPTINGDGSATRDFTYIKNVLEINELAAITKNEDSLNQVYNVAFGKNINLNILLEILTKQLSKFDKSISEIKPKYGEERIGDIKDSLASIEKAKKHLNYNPKYSVEEGLEEAIDWYWKYFNN